MLMRQLDQVTLFQWLNCFVSNLCFIYMKFCFKKIAGSTLGLLLCLLMVQTISVNAAVDRLVGTDISNEGCKTSAAAPVYASDGTWSDWVHSYDPDCFRVFMSDNEAMRVHDVQVCIQIADHGWKSQQGVIQCAPWSTEGGGWSNWAYDTNKYDPDCVRIGLEVNSESIDVCPNIDGRQESVPIGYELQKDICVSVSCPDEQTVVEGVCQSILCAAENFCVGDELHYRSSACTVSPVEVCEYGCVDGTCIPEDDRPILSAERAMVRDGDTVTISWSGGRFESCVVEGTNGDRWEGQSGVVTSSEITHETRYRLVCDGKEFSSLLIRLLARIQET